jgi:hypothetical protein
MLPGHAFLRYWESSDSKWDDENRGIGHSCVRALSPRRHLVSDIANHRANVGVVIAIMKEARPNVMYELGVRNALNANIHVRRKGMADAKSARRYGRSFLSYS